MPGARGCALPLRLASSLGHQRDVFAPLAQRRQVQAHDVEAMQEIGAEFAARDLRIQILMRRREHTCIRAQELAPAEAIQLAGREHAQGAASAAAAAAVVADFVEGNSSCRRSACSNRPAWRRAAPVNAPTSWPNNSDSSSSAGIAAVFSATNGLTPRADFTVQRTRDELLAGAGLAGDEHAEPARGDAPDRAEQLAHRRAAADELCLADGVLGHRHRLRTCSARARAKPHRDGLIEIEAASGR